MRGYIANTDHDWYQFLSRSLKERPHPALLAWHNKSCYLG